MSENNIRKAITEGEGTELMNDCSLKQIATADVNRMCLVKSYY